VPIQEILRKMGISEPTFYRWKQKLGGIGLAEIHRLKRLKQMVADLSLDKQTLQDVLSKKL
jgi:putative transposase